VRNALGGNEQNGKRLETSCTELEGDQIFLVWIRSNPLKSPDSDE